MEKSKIDKTEIKVNLKGKTIKLFANKRELKEVFKKLREIEERKIN